MSAWLLGGEKGYRGKKTHLVGDVSGCARGSISWGGVAQKLGGDRTWLVRRDGGTGRARAGVRNGRLCPCRSLWDWHWNCHPLPGAALALTPLRRGSLVGGAPGVSGRGGFGPVPPARA